ncbi:MAG: RnfABCDGE type electron transport complex subunit D, partial [Oscillospiraceae bacterium]
NDPVTSPKRTLPKIIYGFTAGIVGMGFRHIGRYEESLLFAILVMNASVWVLDLLGEHIAHYYRRKQREYQRNTKAQILDEENSADIKE